MSPHAIVGFRRAEVRLHVEGDHAPSTGASATFSWISSVIRSSGLSAQVLKEFYVTVKGRPGGPWLRSSPSRSWRSIACFPTVPTDYPLIVSAVEISLRYGVSYCDGEILAAAEVLEAPIVYAEDLSHGQRYGSFRAVNPFLPARPDQPPAPGIRRRG